MRLQDDLDFTTLNWVKHELDETLKEARQALEAFVEDPDDTSQMRFCATYLHQVQGTLRMVELYGAALVVEEMERVALGLIDGSVTRQDDVYSVLMRGIVQLPDYLERLQSGHRDIPIVLLPLLNDLRASRGEKLLSENVLFRPNLEVDLPASAAGPAAPVPEDKLQAAVTRLRMAFEFGLLKWFRDDDAEEILTRLITIADRLRSVTSAEQARRLWWVAGGVLEALLVRGLDPSVSVKLLFGRVDREIKRLVDGGEDSFRQSPPDDLVRSLLYYVAHSQATSRRVTELRETFQLNDLLPDAGEIEHAKGALAGHNRQLLDTVSGAIKEDLLRVKDALDLHLRRDEAGAEDLEPLSRDLDSVADTLGMLGLGVPRKVVLEQRGAIEAMIAGERKDDEDALLDIAGALLYVESSLDDHIEALGAPARSDEPVIAPVTDLAPAEDASDQDHGDDQDAAMSDQAAVVGGASESELPHSEVRRILDALIKEAHTNINQAKQEIIAFIEAPWDHSRIVESPRLLEEILGALKMLDLNEPAEVVAGILEYVEQELLDKKEVPTAEELDTLADTVASIEYYLEGVREHRPGRDRVLQVARESVERLCNGTVGGQDLELDSDQQARLDSDELGAVDLSLLDEDESTVDADSSAASGDEDELAAEGGGDLRFEAPSDDDLAGFDWPPADDSAADQADAESRDAPSGPDDDTAEAPTADGEGTERAQPGATEGERERIHDLSNDIDDDIREVFVEEVGEELDNLKELYPRWKADTEDTETLTTIRRIFHTLKGSGRLVGAIHIGEFSWKIENMLNRVLDDTIGVEPHVVALLDQAMAAMPELQAQLQDESNVPEADIAGIMTTADRIAAGETAFVDDIDAESATDEADTETDSETDSETDGETDSEGLSPQPVPSAELTDQPEDGTGDETDELAADADQVTEQDSVDADASIDLPAQGLASSDNGESDSDTDDWNIGDLDLAMDEDEDQPQASGDLSVEGSDEMPTESGTAEQAASDEDASRLRSELIAEAEDLLPSFDMLPGEGAEPDGVETDGDTSGGTQAEEIADRTTADAPPSELADSEGHTGAQDATPDAAQEHGLGASDADGAEARTDQEQVTEQPVGGTEMDPVLLDIFQGEVSTHISGIRAYLDQVADADEPVPVTDELLRAVHTLNGAAAMVDASMVSDLTGPLEGYVKRLRLLDAAPDADGIVALGACATIIGALSRAIGSDTSQMPDTQGLIDNLREMRDALPEPGEGASLFGIGEDMGEDSGDEGASLTSSSDEERSGTAAADDQQDDTHSAGESAAQETRDAGSAMQDSAGEWDLSGVDLADDDQDSEADAGLESGTGADAAPESGFTSERDQEQESQSVTDSGIEVEEVDELPADWLGEMNTDRADLNRDQADSDTTLESDAGDEQMESAAEDEPDAESEVREAGDEQDSVAPVDERDEPDAQETTASDTDRDHGQREPESTQGEVDDELLEIFLQEGNEILDEADSRMARWRDEPESMELIAGLQRDLHTLKGGARMAGLSPIGDLSHAMESVFTEVAEDNLEVSRTMIEVLENAFDRLHGMLEKVDRRESVELPKAAMMELDALLPGGVRHDLDDDGPAQAFARHDKRPGADVIDFPKVRPGPDSDEEQVKAQPLRAQEIIRVRSELLDNLVNYAGEVSIYRSRLEQQVGNYRFNLTEFEQTVTRLRDQLRKLEIETEAQILSRFQREAEQEQGEDFDPLEMDRFSQIQQLSRALAESVSDLVSIQEMLDDITSQSETLLLQQSRVSSDLQEGLMRTRMVPFESLVPRLRRILRQACQELGKRAQLRVEGAQGEMDRNVLERITAPLEHMLRNAVAHGIESPEQREAQGKPAEGTIHIEVSREATEVVLDISDDGAGIDLEAVRDRALERDLLIEGAEFTDRDLLGFILETGFSTADTVTKLAGRGVGLDVVNSEIKQLGGSLGIDTERGKGSSFEVRLPFTLAVTHAIMVRVGDTHFAVPLSGIQSVVRLSQDEFDERVRSGNPVYQFAGLEHQIMDLNVLLGLESQHVTEDDQVPLLMVRVGDRRAAVRVDSVLDAREIVVKSVGPQVSTVPGIYGATILGDGSVVLILDLSPLVRRGAALQLQLDTEVTPFVPEAEAEEDRMPVVMVVDDSITMRKVTSRVLERNEMEVVTAKDGVDALTQLQERVPDVMLLDIEMPRMDGYELATIMRNDTRLAAVPIIMITSRTGEKHRQRAFDIGVERYLGKPYQEGDLLSNINELLARESGDTH